MSEIVLEAGEVIVVEADKITTKKDQTSSIRNVSTEIINILPVEDAGDVIEMQAGVVGGHFRGGRIGEVTYLVDGMQVDNAFNREQAVDFEKESIQDLEVITGTFDAEYGQAMSGVVNIITKVGGNDLHGMMQSYLGNYFTSNNDIFIGLKESEMYRNQDYKFSLEGPIWKDHLTFFMNYRHENNKDHLNGIRRFNVSDSSDFSDFPLYSEATGDSAYVPMNENKNTSFFGKLTFKSGNLKTSFSYTRNREQRQDYSHLFKYNPDGLGTSYGTSNMYSLQLNHMFIQNAFYELKFWYKKAYNGWYLFEDPTDKRYVHDKYLASAQYCGFYTGGQQKDYIKLTAEDWNGKFDFTWQISKNHSIKTGVIFTQHSFDHLSSEVRNKWWGTVYSAERYEPQLAPDSTVWSDIYVKKPYQFAAYLQDKMEFNEMVIKLGLRFDYFDPGTKYPSQKRNPDNKLRYEDPERMSHYLDAKPKYQLSPRLGISYQLGKIGLLRFSFGHFFQRPPFSDMYSNSLFLVGPSDLGTIMGNPQLKAEKTVSYEIGLWQELMAGMSLEVALFYKDIYDLRTVTIITTYNQIRYGLFGNLDYGNARGLEVKYDVVLGKFSAGLNYTLQYTRANADNPWSTFTRAGESMDPIPTLIPLSWDQRHTLNVTIGYNTKDYGATMIGYYGSGNPYSYTPLSDNPLSRISLYPNNSKMPSTFTVDMRAQYELGFVWGLKLRAELNIYNLLDKKNEIWVNSTTGRANQAIVRATDIAGHRSNFNDYNDRIEDPSAFGAPRLIKFGLGLIF